MVDMFIGDINDGITDTGVKAGLLKCAIDPRASRTASSASCGPSPRPTARPVPDHGAHPPRQPGRPPGEERSYDEEGVKPERVVLGHSGDSGDVDHLSALADMGYVLGMDRFGMNTRDDVRGPRRTRSSSYVVAATREMVLAHDTSCYIDWIDPNVVAMMTQWNYLHIGQEVLPYLRERGVTEERSPRCSSAPPAAFRDRGQRGRLTGR